MFWLNKLRKGISIFYSKSLHRKLLEEKIRKIDIKGYCLDIGSKNRRYDYLFKKCKRIFAIDIKPNLEKKIIVCDAVKLCFKDNVFDCIISFEVINYISNYLELFKEVKRVLKEKGKFIFTSPFLVPICQDYDLVRFTESYLREILKEEFSNIVIQSWGGRYSVAYNSIFERVRFSSKVIKLIFFPLFFILEKIVVVFDRWENNPFYIMGYLVTAKK